ncbi:hypothetical protein BGZ99_002505, partial [Dissophora globulifera]
MSSTAPLDPNDATPRNVGQKSLRFYYDSWFVKKSWEVKKAQKACYDYSIKAMLRLVGGNESTRVVNLNVIFCIGLGSFNTRTDLLTKHGELERRFVSKARSLGYSVVGCNKYITSAKCPRLKCDTFLQPTENRSQHYPKCKMHLDRDIAAAENIAQ